MQSRQHCVRKTARETSAATIHAAFLIQSNFTDKCINLNCNSNSSSVAINAYIADVSMSFSTDKQ